MTPNYMACVQRLNQFVLGQDMPHDWQVPVLASDVARLTRLLGNLESNGIPAPHPMCDSSGEVSIYWRLDGGWYLETGVDRDSRLAYVLHKHVDKVRLHLTDLDDLEARGLVFECLSLCLNSILSTPERTMFAIMDERSGLLMPEVKRGYTHVYLQDLRNGCYANFPPRLFLTRRGAEQALRLWRKGPHVKGFTRSMDFYGQDDDMRVQVDEFMDPGRQFNLMRVIEMRLCKMPDKKEDFENAYRDR